MTQKPVLISRINTIEEKEVSNKVVQINFDSGNIKDAIDSKTETGRKKRRNFFRTNNSLGPMLQWPGM
jgi:hypothetical protein